MVIAPAAAPARRRAGVTCPVALTPDEQEGARKKASSDLLFLFSRNDVDGLVVAGSATPESQP